MPIMASMGKPMGAGLIRAAFMMAPACTSRSMRLRTVGSEKLERARYVRETRRPSCRSSFMICRSTSSSLWYRAAKSPAARTGDFRNGYRFLHSSRRSIANRRNSFKEVLRILHFRYESKVRCQVAGVRGASVSDQES